MPRGGTGPPGGQGNALTTLCTSYVAADARGAVPVLGHTLALLRDPRGFLRSLPDQGDLVWLRVGSSRILVVCDPELTHQVLVNDRDFDKGGPWVDRLREILGNSLVSCPRSQHRRFRRLIQPAFHKSRLPDYSVAMVDQTTAVVDGWKDGQTLDVYAGMQEITARIIARTMFASPASDTVVDVARAALNVIVTNAGRRLFLPPLLARIPTRGKRRYDRARREIREITDTLIADYRAAGVDHHDLMSMLLAARDEEDGSALTEQEVSDHVVTLFLGGMETTASTLGWALCLLAQHPDVERRLQQEVDAVVGDEVPSYKHVPDLTFASAILTETMRLFAPGWMLTRRTSDVCELGGHTIPGDTDVIYSPYILHHRGDLFPDPDRFDPDRWTGEPARLPRGALVPFSGGPRKCVGDDFAMAEGALILACFVSRWQLHPIERDVRPKQRFGLVLAPRKQRVRITRRRRDVSSSYGAGG
jgi:cytochrome P450